jgi:coenzyme F420-reducing hydrogenase alpha subunit
MRESKINDILTQNKDNPLLEYVKELWNLIDYLNKKNEKDRIALIALKHKKAWSHYDKSIENYDKETRIYKKPKNPEANESC